MSMETSSKKLLGSYCRDALHAFHGMAHNKFKHSFEKLDLLLPSDLQELGNY